jgi:hypothetical protein
MAVIKHLCERDGWEYIMQRDGVNRLAPARRAGRFG